MTQGLLKEADVDKALRRLLRSQMRLGVYDPPERLPWASFTVENTVDSPKHRALALEAARKSIVLLKNQDGTLPLKKGLNSIAVIGPNADDVEVAQGNYSGTPIAPVTVLAGIKAAAGPGTKVTHARGGPLASGLADLQLVPASALFHAADGKTQPGLRPSTTRRTSTGRPWSVAWTRRWTSIGLTGVPRRRSTTMPSASGGWGRSRRRPRAGTCSGCVARRCVACWWRTSRSRRADPTTNRPSCPEPSG